MRVSVGLTRIVRVVFGGRDVAATLSAARVPAGAWLHAVLAPPLSQVRAIELPRMTRTDAQNAVARNPGRYFPDAREPQVVAVRRTRSGWIAAATPAVVVDAIHEAARAMGCNVAVIEPAAALWARIGGSGAFAVTSDGQTTLLAARGGALESVRRTPEGAPWPAEFRNAAVLDVAASRPLNLASLASTLDLRPDPVARSRAALVRRVVFWSSAVAAGLLFVAASATLWGERQELAALRAYRASLRAQVQTALTQRDTLLTNSEQLGAVAALQRGSERWSAVVARVAEALPRDASLTAFRAEADSVSLEGEARNAAGVFAAMRSAPGVLGVHAAAPVRQEGGGSSGQPVVERFTLGARLKQPGGAP